VPEDQWNAFLTDVVDRYQPIAADNPSELNTFKFYQMEMEVVLDVDSNVRVG
jgi:hypothetical protein